MSFSIYSARSNKVVGLVALATQPIFVAILLSIATAQGGKSTPPGAPDLVGRGAPPVPGSGPAADLGGRQDRELPPKK